MWCFLKDELLNDIVPTIMKFNKESDKVKAEALVKRIDDALVKTGSGYSLERLYQYDASFRKEVEYFATSEDPYLGIFGGKVVWLVTKGPHFYHED